MALEVPPNSAWAEGFPDILGNRRHGEASVLGFDPAQCVGEPVTEPRHRIEHRRPLLLCGLRQRRHPRIEPQGARTRLGTAGRRVDRVVRVLERRHELGGGGRSWPRIDRVGSGQDLLAGEHPDRPRTVRPTTPIVGGRIVAGPDVAGSIRGVVVVGGATAPSGGDGETRRR